VSKFKKTPTKCSSMHMFKKFESFGHSPKRQVTNIFTVDNEIHNATKLNDELSGIKKLNRSLFGSNSLNNIDETPNGLNYYHFIVSLVWYSCCINTFCMYN